jgi:malate permease and related proteins
MIFQNLLTFTYGLLNSVSVHHDKGSKIFLEFLEIPTVYAVLLGLLIQSFSVKLPLFLSIPIENAANAFLAIALATLGAQSAYLKIYKISLVLSLSILGRLVLAPLLALLIITCLGIEGTSAQALFIASSFPTSRNSSLFALEYNNHPETAAQVVVSFDCAKQRHCHYCSLFVENFIYLKSVYFYSYFAGGLWYNRL